MLAERHAIVAIDVRERHAALLTAALAGHTGPRVIDQHAAHGLRCDREEVGAILKRNRLAADEPEVELVDHGVRFERVIGPFAPKQVRRQLPQLGVDDREELIAGVLVSGAPTRQPAGDFSRFRNKPHAGSRGMILTARAVR